MTTTSYEGIGEVILSQPVPSQREQMFALTLNAPRGFQAREPRVPIDHRTCGGRSSHQPSNP
jgi:hypothetical protein